MNKTKRKIFEASMRLFAEKGYEATSIEEITATVGVAKGTLYYHFASKEEIFNFLAIEGMNLIKNSIEIKTSKLDNAGDKIKAIILIQIKVLAKYEQFITLLLSQIWGNEARNNSFREIVFDYIKLIEEIVREGIKKGELNNGDPEIIASGVFGLISSSMIYKLKNKKEMDINRIYNDFVNYIFNAII